MKGYVKLLFIGILVIQVFALIDVYGYKQINNNEKIVNKVFVFGGEDSQMVIIEATNYSEVIDAELFEQRVSLLALILAFKYYLEPQDIQLDNAIIINKHQDKEFYLGMQQAISHLYIRISIKDTVNLLLQKATTSLDHSKGDLVQSYEEIWNDTFSIDDFNRIFNLGF